MNVAPTDWRSCGDLQSLVDASTATALARSAGLPVLSLRPDYLRLKVGESALVGYEATVDDSARPVPLHVRTFVDRERAVLLHQKWLEKRRDESRMSPPEAISSSGLSVFFAFPNDNELDGLRRVSVPRGWRHLLPSLPLFAARSVSQHDSTVTPVRYKPGRRLVGRVSLVEADGHTPFVDGFFRWFGDDRGAAVARVSAAAHAAGIAVPRPIDVSVDGRLVIEAPLPGVDGAIAMAAGALDIEEFARSLRRFHQLRVDGAPMAPRRTVAEALAALDVLALVAPSLAAAAMRLALHLRGADEPDGPPALVHGDLHLGQLVVHGGTASLVDLERAHHGHPQTDLASLAAHLVECRIDDPGHRADEPLGDLRRAWVAAGGDGDDLVGLPLACALVQRALLAFRTFDPRWPDIGAALLEHAIDAAGAPRWQTVHARPSGHWTASGDDDRTPRAAISEGRHWESVDPDRDERLPGLAAALERGRLVAHRPGRRAVVHTGGSYLKVLPPKRARALVDRLTTVAPLLPPNLRAPGVLSVDAVLGIVEIESMAGTSFHDLLVGNDRDARAAAIELAAQLVAAFGAVDVTRVALPEAGDGGDSRAWAATIAGIHPTLAVVHAPVVDRLEYLRDRYLIERPLGLVHGDLHDRNLLLGDRSGAIIDLDSVGLGDPAIDLGNLAAHLVLRAMQRGDTPTGGRGEAEALLDVAGATAAHRVHVARTLHRLSCVYRLRARWAYLSNDLLAASAEWADSID